MSQGCGGAFPLTIMFCEAGMRWLGNKYDITNFNFEMDLYSTDCGGKGVFLLILAQLVRQKFISPTSKAIFTEDFCYVHREQSNPPLYALFLSSIQVAVEGGRTVYEIEYGDVGCHWIGITRMLKGITIESEQRRSRLCHRIWACKQDLPHKNISCMLPIDFCGMHARRWLFSEERGVTTPKRVLATLMGSHGRLGCDSWLGKLDPGVLVIIVRGTLSLPIREAIDVGLLRL